MEITESDYLMNLPTVFDVNEVGLLGGVFRIQDLQTGTIWTHLDGKAIAGPLVGHRLKMVPTPQATWAGWKSGNTETVMGRRPNPPRPNAVM